MSVNNGVVSAPVGLYEVAELLGEPQNLEDACRSGNINPYSLIRPFPPLMPDPSFEVKAMKDGSIGHIPESGSNYLWYRGKWGYFVPYVSLPGNITAIKDIPWQRPGIGVGDFCNLAHFDGYRHFDQPNIAVSLDVSTGQPIVVSIFPGMTQKDIVSSTGEKNNGGVVSIQEVLGNVKLGFSLFRGSGSNLSLRQHYIMSQKIGETDEIFAVVGETAVAGTTYTVIPWATDGDIINGQVVSGSKFFTVKFAESFEATMSSTAPNYDLFITVLDFSFSLGRISLTVEGRNTYPNMPHTVSNFRLYVSYRDGNITKNETITLAPVGTNMTIPANSTARATLTTNAVPSGAKLIIAYLIAHSSTSTREIQSPFIDLGPIDE